MFRSMEETCLHIDSYFLFLIMHSIAKNHSVTYRIWLCRTFLFSQTLIFSQATMKSVLVTCTMQHFERQVWGQVWRRNIFHLDDSKSLFGDLPKGWQSSRWVDIFKEDGYLPGGWICSGGMDNSRGRYYSCSSLMPRLTTPL